MLPESQEDFLILRPLGGTEEETAGVYIPLEPVEPAHFGLPDPRFVGDYRSCRLLRDAVRVGFRSSAGPFRSFGRIAVEPRPYQLVPLLMALKLDPVRLLIADDVGIGKTIEACLIARELLDRGEINSLAVLCPPALAEQWQNELKEKFHIDTKLVLSSTALRLERNCGVAESLFDYYPFVVVSMDFIKSERRKNDFIRACPDLVIVDEAHSCAADPNAQTARHQRYQLVKRLSETGRHMLFVTATPHSGNEENFRSLLSFLQPDFAHLPPDLSGKDNEPHRRRLAQYFVQRRRGDIKKYLDTETIFPEREEAEVQYALSPDYKKLFDKVLRYTRETIQNVETGSFQQRVRWWAALSLLRSLASSPAAAALTLRNRSAVLDTESIEEADELGRRSVLDQAGQELAEDLDIAPGAVAETDEQSANTRRLAEMAREADKLQGDKDNKLLNIVNWVDELLKEGFNPILFCRFIPTSDYVAEELRKRLKQKAEIVSVTGLLPPAEREERIAQLQHFDQRVLVCTDCLSEGINLQELFNAVIHYDLSWNPTRHEQREGRVDRFLQQSRKVRMVTLYGIDNQIDGIVLDVLIRKHRSIRNSLGISVPVPVKTDQLIQAILEGFLLREKKEDRFQMYFEDFTVSRDTLHHQWEQDAEREKRSRTMFAQETIKVDEVVRELTEIRRAIGSGVELATFTTEAVKLFNGYVSKNGTYQFNLQESPHSLRDTVGEDFIHFNARFDVPVQKNEIYLCRTHPFVEGLAAYVMDRALDPEDGQKFHRCGVIRTRQVKKRTTLLVVRLRFHIITKRRDTEKPLLAEDCLLLAFAGSPAGAEWLDESQAEELLLLQPDANVSSDIARDFIQKVIEGYGEIEPRLIQAAHARGEALLEKHRRIRAESNLRGVQYRVEPHLPPDVLGIYVFLPVL
ncbi:MAG: helicase-related protein [bacterium]